MSTDYTNISDLYRTVVECEVIDLMPHISALEPALINSLDDSRLGLYLPNMVEPFFQKDHKYECKQNNISISISFEDIVNDVLGKTKLPKGDIFVKTTEKIIRRTFYETIKNKLIFETDKLVRGCEAAIAVVLSYLNTLCPKYTYVHIKHYDLNKIIKEEFKFLITEEKFETAFDDLCLQVYKFVKSDTWNIYSYKVVGTTLVLEKGLDYRIIDWYKTKIKTSEHYDHDFGGLMNGSSRD